MKIYLKAVACARKGDASGVMTNLKDAIAKDGSFKQMAKEDAEFLKWKTEIAAL